MPLFDITSDFLSYVQDTRLSYTTSWNSSIFLKSSNSALQQISSLQQKMNEFKKILKSSSRFDKQKNNKMIQNIKQNIKIMEQTIKRIFKIQSIDIKGGYQIIEQFKSSIITTLEMRFLKVSLQFKEIYFNVNSKNTSNKNFTNSNPRNQNINKSQNKQINLNRSHFLSQSKEQLIEQASVNEYKQIQKLVNQILQMYTKSLNVLKLSGLMVDQISNNINDIQSNVEEGKKNVAQMHRRQSKNRNLIIKLFTTLYIVTFVYIVFLS